VGEEGNLEESLVAEKKSAAGRKSKRPSKKTKSSQWHLYWVESDGIEDSFVVARNARSARGVEIRMNGFDPEDVIATKVAKISPYHARSYFKENPERSWPGYVYGKILFEKLGAQFRTIEGQQEMLLDDVVYDVIDYAPCAITWKRLIGKKAFEALWADPILQSVKHEEEDLWTGPTSYVITGLGMCLATCQLIEHYIAHSFLLGVSKRQKKQYETINDLVAGWKRKTLGNMIKSMEEAWEIDPDLKANLEIFLANRNRFIHGITTEDRFNIRTHWGREELMTFLAFFDVHARIVKLAFRASYYASIDFALHQWGADMKVPPKIFGRKHKREAATFFHFFTPKEDAI
jgi:hypothetical protein